MKLEHVIISLFVVLVGVLGIGSFFIVERVGVFSDGSVHMSIVDYIREHHTVPQDDFLGQININFRQPKSFTIPMIYPQNVYILFSSVSLVTGLGSRVVFDALSIGMLLLSGIFFFFVTVSLTKKKSIGYIATILYFLLPFWYRIVVHRIIEPISLIFSLTVLYLLLKGVSVGSYKYPLLVGFFLFVLFYTKQSNLYFMVIIVLYSFFLKWRAKEVVMIGLSFVVCGFPALRYSYHLLGAISPTPPGIPFLDTKLLNPWRQKQHLQERESTLNASVYNAKIKKITFNQFSEDIQISPTIYAQEGKYSKIIQNFLPLQIDTSGTQGYHLPLSLPIAHLNLLLILFGCLSIGVLRQHDKKYRSFFLLSLGVVILFSLKFTVFRYYLNSVILNSILFAYGIYFLWSRGNKSSTLVLCGVYVIFSMLTISSSLSKNASYSQSIGHRLTNTTGGLAELVALGTQKEEIFQEPGELFTPVLEVAYYVNKKIYRDEKYFFIQKKQDLIYYLNQAGLRYVLNPFFSTTTLWSRWKYYDGIPRDSLFGKMLIEEECFERVYEALSFTLYKISPSPCLDINDEQRGN